MSARALAEQICRTLRAAGHQAYLVGGCVRDILLEREPVDYDVATDATPDQVQRLFPDSLAVGAQFGVIIVLGTGRATAGHTAAQDTPVGTQVEVATFRSDVGLFRRAAPGQSGLRQIA